MWQLEPLWSADSEDGTTICINECSALAEHASTKSWNDNGMEGTVIVKEVYFSVGKHYLLNNSHLQSHLASKFGQPGVQPFSLLHGRWHALLRAHSILRIHTS